jgi:hypothetical protein
MTPQEGDGCEPPEQTSTKPVYTKPPEELRSPAGSMSSAEPWAEVYKAVRAHELMLNQAASQFEHAFLAPLIVLNGGAVVAFLTLLGADANLAWDKNLAAAAIIAWGIGLVLAAFAVRFALELQRQTNIGFRLMRQELEEEFFGDKLVRITRPPPLDDADDEATRPGAGKSARTAGRWMRGTRALSVLAFGIGALLALVAVWSG